MEIKAKALILKAEDYGENDKLAVCLTDTAGKIRARLRGVKKSSAKLKFAGQPFCFMDAVIHKRGDFYTVVTASPLDLFYSIITDLNNLYAGSVILEAADAMTGYNSNGELLPVALSGLQCLCYNAQTDPRVVAAKFLSEALIACGYTIQLDHCISCFAPLTEREAVCFDLAGGGVKCAVCATEGDKSIKPGTYDTLKSIRSCGYEDLSRSGLQPDAARGALAVYGKLIEINFFKKLNSLAALAGI